MKIKNTYIVFYSSGYGLVKLYECHSESEISIKRKFYLELGRGLTEITEKEFNRLTQ